MNKQEKLRKRKKLLETLNEISNLIDDWIDKTKEMEIEDKELDNNIKKARFILMELNDFDRVKPKILKDEKKIYKYGNKIKRLFSGIV